MNGLVAFLRRPWGSVLLGALALLAVVGAGLLVGAEPADSAPEPVVEPVASAELMCPITVATSALVSTVSAGVAPVPGVADGRASLATLTVDASVPRKAVEAPGDVVTDIIEGKPSAPRTARATGSWAAGFGADQVARSGQGATRGLAASPCARPITEGWILGGGSTVGRSTQVLLVNDDDRAAQVDLLVHGTEGEIASPAGSGVVVPPLSRTIVRLSALAPEQDVTAIHVVARSGRIAASALETVQDGLIPLGMSALPVTQAGTAVVIPSVPAVAGARLVLLAPDGPAEATLSVLAESGSFTPTGFEDIALDQGRVSTLDLTDVLAGEPSGLVVRSDSPVVAAVLVTTGTGTQLRERDVTAGTPELSAPGVVVGLRTGIGSGTFLHSVGLAAPGDAAVVRLDVYESGSTTPVRTETVDVAAGTSVTAAVEIGKDGSLLVVTPVRGLVHATRQLVENGPRGPMLALAPLLPVRATTTVPPVVSVPGSSLS